MSEVANIGSFVDEAQTALSQQVDFPPGYIATFGGQFELAQAANRRLAVVIPITVLLIFGMLFASFNNAREAFLIIPQHPAGTRWGPRGPAGHGPGAVRTC